ncbi:MAG: glycosyltransferase family 4 protein, partial [Acidobacteria bacterium]|nr:glycosyltransferase family 4 protein [Acidobacteriota bacterium]
MRNSFKLSQQASGFWTRWLIAAPNALLVNSQVVVEEIAESKLIARERLWFVPNALDLDEFDGHAAERSERPAAILVARLIQLKRVDCFLRALAQARLSNPALCGIVVGDGPERSALENLARELSLLPDHVTFLGARRDVPQLLARADMLVSSSDDEGCPNVILEAMAARLPVVSTPAGDARTIVQDDVTGYRVPFADVDAMAGRILGLAESPSLRRALGEAGRRYIEQSFSFAGLADRLLAIYRAVAEQRHDERLYRVLSTYQSEGGVHHRQHSSTTTAAGDVRGAEYTSNI